MPLAPLDQRALDVLVQERDHLKVTTDAVRRLAKEFPGANLGGLVKRVEEAWKELEAEIRRRTGP